MDAPRAAPIEPTWRAADFEALSAYNGVLEIDLFRGARPPIQVDVRGYDQMAFCGEISNPFALAACEAFEAAQMRAEAVLDGGAKADLPTRAHEARALQDKILAAVCIRPRYCPREQLVAGKPPPGQFWYGSFTAEQRRLLADFFYNGADALLPFRPRPGADEPAPRLSDGVPPASERGSDPARAGVSPLVAGHGAADMAPSAGPSGGGGGGDGGDAPRAMAGRGYRLITGNGADAG